MNKVYFKITGVVTTVKLVEVNISGDLISGGIELNGTQIGSTGVYYFNVTHTRYYTLSVDSVLQSNASTMLLFGGSWIYADTNGKPQLLADLDANAFGISNLKDAVADNDAVNFVQIKPAINDVITTLTKPTVNVTVNNTCHFLKLHLSSDGGYASIPFNTGYIFFYSVETSSTPVTFSVDSKGKITSSGAGAVTVAFSNTPEVFFPKDARWTSGSYINAGYVLANFKYKSTVKQLNSPVQIASGDALYGLSLYSTISTNPTSAKPPIITDLGNRIGITIDATDYTAHTGHYEILVGYLGIGETEPTVIGNVVTGLVNYQIYRSNTRYIEVPKPILPVGSYKIYTTFRFCNIVSVSNWWYATTTNKLQGLTVTKQPSYLSDKEMDAVMDYVCSNLITDSSFNIIRK